MNPAVLGPLRVTAARRDRIDSAPCPVVPVVAAHTSDDADFRPQCWRWALAIAAALWALILLPVLR